MPDQPDAGEMIAGPFGESDEGKLLNANKGAVCDRGAWPRHIRLRDYLAYRCVLPIGRFLGNQDRPYEIGGLR